MEEQRLNTYLARVKYLALLEGGLRSWTIYDDKEQEKINLLLKLLEDYEDILIDKINSDSDR